MLSSYSILSPSALYSSVHTHTPSTPSRSTTTTTARRYQPRNPSPLVSNDSSPARGPSPSTHRTSSPLLIPMSSPTTAAQERRRGQYKSLVSCRTPEASSPARRLFSNGGASVSAGRLISAASCSSKRSAQAFFSQIASAQSQDPTKLFLREQFQARCRERARKARQRTISERRGCGSSSDVGGFGIGIGDEEMDCDEEETEDDIMQDEVYLRLRCSARC